MSRTPPPSPPAMPKRRLSRKAAHERTLSQPARTRFLQQDGGSTEAARSATQSNNGQEPKEWLTDAHRELASSYGLADEDLKDFGSEAEFRRATRLIDRQLTAAVEAQRQAQERANQEQTRKQAEDAAKANQATSTAPKLTKLDLAKLKEAGYDEDTINLLKTQNDVIDYLESSEKEKAELREQTKRLEQQFQSFSQMSAQPKPSAAPTSSTKRSMAWVMSGSAKPSAPMGSFRQLSRAADDNRRKLYDTAEMLAQGMLAQQRAAGMQPQLPPLSVILQRAKALAFAEDIRAEERKKVQAEVTAQAKRVRPVATQSAPTTANSPARKTSRCRSTNKCKRRSTIPAWPARWLNSVRPKKGRRLTNQLSPPLTETAVLDARRHMQWPF
jgi:hypothetical protein